MMAPLLPRLPTYLYNVEECSQLVRSDIWLALLVRTEDAGILRKELMQLTMSRCRKLPAESNIVTLL